MVKDGVLQIESMKDRCTDAEWQARVDLAACYRLVDLYGLSDMMANHVSSHVPGEPGAFLINAYGMMYEEITASSLIKIDIHGNILSKPDFGELNYTTHAPRSPASFTPTAGPQWRCLPSNAGCCRSRKPRCVFSRSATTTTRAWC